MSIRISLHRHFSGTAPDGTDIWTWDAVVRSGSRRMGESYETRYVRDAGEAVADAVADVRHKRSRRA